MSLLVDASPLPRNTVSERGEVKCEAAKGWQIMQDTPTRLVLSKVEGAYTELAKQDSIPADLC